MEQMKKIFGYWAINFLILFNCNLFANVSASEQIGPERVAVNQLKYLFFPMCHENPIIHAESIKFLKSISTPSAPITDKDVKYFLYTRENPLVPQIIHGNDPVSVIKSKIDPKKEIVFYSYGYFESYIPAAIEFPTHLLPQEDVNVLIADWDKYSFSNFMLTSNYTVPRLGRIFGDFFNKLIKAGADPKKITLIGFSSGSQAIGIGAQAVRPKIARILAFAPGSACYDYVPRDQRISKDDADFVIVVRCSTGFLGTDLGDVGDVTFYVNGGIMQPQCAHTPTTIGVNICSHFSCLHFIYSSLEPIVPYYGVRCNTYEDYLHNKCDCKDKVPLIYDLSSSTPPGLYFIETTSSEKKLCG